MKREDKRISLLFFIISMVVCVICGYSGRTPFVPADIKEEADIAAEEEMSDTTSDTWEEDIPPEEDVEADAPKQPKKTKKPKKKYAKWHYDEKTRTLTIGGAKETHNEKYTVDGYEGKYEWPHYRNISIKKMNKVEKVVVQKGVVSINSAAFAYCSNVREIVLPNTLRTIRDYVFYECKSLEEVTLPDNVRSIGRECFRGCTSLKKITLGRKVKHIGEGSFLKCPLLRDIALKEGSKCFAIKDGILYNRKEKIVYWGIANGEYVSIEKGIKQIAALAFAENVNLREIKIPASITEIGGGAFYHCKNLEQVTFAKDSNCRKMDSYWVRRLYSGDFGDTYGCFEGCEKLQEMVFPESLRSMGYSALIGCSSLKRIHFGRNFWEAGYWEGYAELISSDSLTKVEVSEENRRYSSEDGVLYDKGKERLIFYPNGKRDLEFTVPESVRCIEAGAFNQCRYLESLVLPGNYMTIQIQGIERCAALRSVSIYGDICKLDISAISECPKLRSVKIYGMNTKLQSEGNGQKLPVISYCNRITIYARKGSKAEKYAKRHKKFKFAALD